MALPEDVTTITLNFGQYGDAEGLAALVAAGGKLFPVDPSTDKPINVTHVASGMVIVPKPVEVTIGADGTGSVGPIPHTDNPGLSPVGFAYRVEWNIPSGHRHPSPKNKTIALPQAKGATADYDLLVAADNAPGVVVPVTYGKSAYDLAAENGFVGTEAAWLESLVGPMGTSVPTGGAGGALSGSYPSPGLNETALDAATGALVADADSATAASLRVALDARIAEQPTVVAAAAVAVDSAVQAGNVVPRFPDVGLIPPQVVVKDTFTRANNTSSMGTAETGQAWVLTAPGAEAGIIDNAAYLRAAGSGLRHTVIDCGQRNVTVTLDAVIPAASSIGFSLRSIDATNAIVLSYSEGSQTLTISSVNDGTATIRATVPITLPAGAHRLAARIEGDENATFIQSYLDDVLVHTHALNSTDRAKFATATRHGIRWATSSTTVRADAITITTPVLPTSKQLREWAAAEAYEVLTAAALDTDGFVPSATVRWPDGAPGIYTLVTKKLDAAYKAVDAYTLTHISAGRKVTQTAPTRAATGNVTAKPALTVGAI